jgi:hypothetical protein
MAGLNYAMGAQQQTDYEVEGALTTKEMKNDLNEMMGGRLQTCIADTGRAQTILHNGPKRTPQMEATLEFEADHGINTYYQRLFHVAGDL